MIDHAQDERAIFLAALEQATDGEREAYVRGACVGQPELLKRLLKLLSAHQLSLGPLDAPPPGLAASPAIDQPPAERPGTIIGPYKLLEQIGEGGFGVVFMAEQREPVRRKVALKVLKPGMDTHQVVARFEAERQALALMDHPHIAHVFDGGETASGRPYFVMELVRGIPITDFCDQSQLPVRPRLELIIDVCQAVQHAHQNGIIHRDLKPTNLLVTMHDEQPMVKVIDFGIAKATGTQLTDKTLFTAFAQMMGTPMYMSPEQAAMSGLDVDTRSDIYSLGVLLYELLTGATPFDKERLRTAPFDEIRRIIREEEPPKPSTRFTTLGPAAATVVANRKSDLQRLRQQCRGELDWVVMKALEKDRNRRYETVNGLARDIERYLRDEPVQACPPSSWYRFRKFARRHKAGMASAVMALAFMFLVCAGAGWFVLDRAARHADTAGRAESALQEAVRLRDKKSWSEARAAAQRADLLLAGNNSHPELRQRLGALVIDLEMVDRLERIREDESAVKGESWDHASADTAYEVAFREYGIDVTTLDGSVAAQRVQASAIGEQLVAALDDWAWLIPREASARREQVRAAVSLADADDWRNRFRDPSLQKDRLALTTLADRPEVPTLPPSTVVLLGRALVAVGASEKAAEVLAAAQRRHPADFWLNQYLGSVLCWYTQPPRYEEAAGYCRAALAIRPSAPAVHMGLGNCFRTRGHEDEAIAHYRRAIELQPDYTHPYHGIGRALANKEAWSEAIDAYQKCLSGKTSPALARNVNYDLGTAYAAINDSDQAIACFWKALEFDAKNVSLQMALFNAIRAQPNKDQTIAFFQQVVEAKPKNARAHAYLGVALWYQGKLNESLGPFTRATQLDPKELAYFESLGNNLLVLNKLEEAVETYQRALQLSPRFAEMHYRLGLALHRAGRVDDAVGSWKNALKVDASHIPAHTAMAWHLCTAADPQRWDPPTALVHAQRAVDAQPDEANHWSNLGVALLRSGDAKAAVEKLEKADQVWDASDNFHRFFLAMAYWEFGDTDKARATYERAVKWMDQNQPDNEELRRFRAEAAELMKKEPGISTPDS